MSDYSYSSLKHHLYADDTQFFWFFHPPQFSASHLFLQNALDKISDWMHANLLTLNSSEAEFLVVGLPQQLCKLSDNYSLVTAILLLAGPQPLAISKRQDHG